MRALKMKSQQAGFGNGSDLKPARNSVTFCRARLSVLMQPVINGADAPNAGRKSARLGTHEINPVNVMLTRQDLDPDPSAQNRARECPPLQTKDIRHAPVG